MLHRGVFHNVEEPALATGGSIGKHNDNPKLLVRTAIAFRVLDMVNRSRAGLENRRAAGRTILVWIVSDILAAVTDLEKADAKFERFPGPPQDELGVWITPDNPKL